MSSLVNGAGCERADHCVFDPACELHDTCVIVMARDADEEAVS